MLRSLVRAIRNLRCRRSGLSSPLHARHFPERGIFAFVAFVLSHLQLSIVPVVGMKALRPPLLFPYLIGAFADEVESLQPGRHRLIFGRELRNGLQCSAVVDSRGQPPNMPCLLSKIVRALHHKTPTT